MPNCFQLIPVGSSEAEPLSTIDEKLCALVGEPIHPKNYVLGWFDNIGFSLSCGKTFDDIKQRLAKELAEETDPNYIPWQEKLLTMAEYLSEHYTINAWYESSSRGR